MSSGPGWPLNEQLQGSNPVRVADRYRPRLVSAPIVTAQYSESLLIGQSKAASAIAETATTINLTVPLVTSSA